jgi:hypothetical protein
VTAPFEARRPRFELADVLRAHAASFLTTQPVSAAQIAVIRHIKQCRTAALGGHVDACDACGHTRISYNSCRDRHCPKCQGLKKAEWLEARFDRLLPVPYAHVVFTIPAELNPVALRNKRIVYSVLFRAASEALLAVAANPRHLGAVIGFTAILHTWGQNLQFHPHLHCVVTAGGLSLDGRRWVAARRKFFLPVRVLARLFRGKFLHYLTEAYRQGQIASWATTPPPDDSSAFDRLKDALYSKPWHVYSKPPFAGAQHVFLYLGRYTHRVAISNARLVEMKDDKVSFRAKHYTSGNRRKLLTLDAVEFIRRFLLHVLPKRFIRIRHFGLMAARNVKDRLSLCRQLLTRSPAPPAPSTPKPKRTWRERLIELTGLDPLQCQRCGLGTMVRLALLQPFAALLPAPWVLDSS